MICVGVDIGSCALKAVAIKKSGKSFNILQTYFYPIKVDANENQKKLLILAHLKTLAELYPSAETKFIFCFSQNDVSTEKLNFPFKERYKILKSLPFQLEDKLSLFDHKNMISDIKISHFTEGKRDVLVFSVFKEEVRSFLKDIMALKITPSILTCEAAAMANLFEVKKESAVLNTEKSNTEKKEGHLYLKIGHSHTMVTLFVENHLQNVYSFEWGVSNCIRKIALKYEIPFSKAMQEFCNKAFVLTETKGYTGSQIEFAKLIQQPLDHLIDKLRLLLLQIRGEGDFECKKMFIYGGGAQIRNLNTLLSAHLNMPVSRVDNPLNAPQWNLRSNEKRQNNLVTALGSAMEGLRKPKSPPICFLKGEFADQFNPFAFTFQRWKPAFTLCLSTLVLFSVYANLRYQQSSKIQDKINPIFRKKSVQVAKIRPTKVSIESVEQFIEDKKGVTKLVQLAQEVDELPSVLDKIKKLSIALKKQDNWNLEIQKLNIIGNKVEIEGNIATKYMKSLQKNLQELAVTGSLKTVLENSDKVAQMEDASAESNTSAESASAEKESTIFFKYLFTQKQG